MIKYYYFYGDGIVDKTFCIYACALKEKRLLAERNLTDNLFWFWLLKRPDEHFMNLDMLHSLGRSLSPF